MTLHPKQTENFKGFKVCENNLLPFLTPTSKGTSWWEPAPENIVHDRYVGRFILQFHQVAEVIQSVHKTEDGVKFLDIGTGNGILPELVGKHLSVSRSVGMDPFIDGEHSTSWARGTRDEILSHVTKCLQGKDALVFEDYRSLCTMETMARPPVRVALKEKSIGWEFKKKFLHELEGQGQFNFFFAKAIDHIPQWKDFFAALDALSEPNSTLLLKHNSFFSFHGAHRYASTFIPWGHVVLSEDEFAEYARKFHLQRSDSMIDFYYSGLAYPRFTLFELQSILANFGWGLVAYECDQTRNLSKKLELVEGGLEQLYKIAKERFPTILLDELTSNRMLLTFKKFG